MVDLQNSDKNLIAFAVNESDSKIGLYYSSVETDDLVKYNDEALQLLLKKATAKEIQDFKIEKGKKILTGIREGDFCCGDVKISSDPQSKNYRADWKDLLAKNSIGVKIINKLVETVYGTESVFVIKKEALPLPKNSEAS